MEKERAEIPECFTKRGMTLAIQDAHERAHKLNDELQEVKIDRDVLMGEVLSLRKRLALSDCGSISLGLSASLRREVDQWWSIARWPGDV